MKAVLTGAGVALVAGLLMGAVAKPDLANDDRPAGPQILAGWSGVRSTGPFDDGQTFAAYNGEIPDYVLGTDWKKALQPPVFAPEPEPRVQDAKLASNDDLPDLPLTPAAYDERPPPEVVYPSMQGGGPSPAEPSPAPADDTDAG